MARFRKNDFFKWAQKIKSVFCFIPHTHEGCDFTIRVYHKVLVVSIHTPTKGVTLEHEGCPATFCCFNPHTHEGCDPKWVRCHFRYLSFNPHTHDCLLYTSDAADE